MSDDWRLMIEVGEPPALERLVEAIGRDKLVREARDALGGRVAVTHDGPHLFVYGDSEEQVRAAQTALRPLLTEQGYPEWEVRLGLPTRHDASALAEQLESEGIPVTRRWRYLLVGAETEDDARALAQRLRDEAPAETELIVEPNGQEVWREMHPYTVLGGLGN
jgi:hypothetical protein